MSLHILSHADSLVAQRVKNLPAMQETLDEEEEIRDKLEKR